MNLNLFVGHHYLNQDPDKNNVLLLIYLEFDKQKILNCKMVRNHLTKFVKFYEQNKYKNFI